MHDLATIIALNNRATERCAECKTARITIEARSPRDYLQTFTIDGKDVLLCRSCVGQRTA